MQATAPGSRARLCWEYGKEAPLGASQWFYAAAASAAFTKVNGGGTALASRQLYRSEAFTLPRAALPGHKSGSASAFSGRSTVCSRSCISSDSGST